MERTSEKLVTEDTVPLPAELNKLKEVADKKIEIQKGRNRPIRCCELWTPTQRKKE